MDEIETLRRKKEKLKLEREIARLEFEAKASAKAGKLAGVSWGVAIFLAVIAALCAMIGFAKVDGWQAFIGVLFLLPLVLKLLLR